MVQEGEQYADGARMPSTSRLARLRALQSALFLVMCFGVALVFAQPAVALGPDEDPIPKFTHLQQQREEVQADLSQTEAQLSTSQNGSFTIQDASTALPVPAGAAARGAVRMPRLTSKHYDVLTGVITFTWQGIGSVVITPSDRRVPRSIYAEGSVVSATGVAQNVSEVTLASNRYLEQHLVVDEQHADIKLVSWSYAFALPARVSALESDSGVVLTYANVPLLSIRADVAVDEAGARFPVAATWDAATSTMTVAYDGRAHDSTGDVAIDPVFFPFASDPQVFVMNVCQAPGTSAACEAVPGTGLPPRFVRLPSSHASYVTGRTSALGIYIQGKVNESIPSGAAAVIAYEALPHTKAVGLALHGTIEPPSGAFSCRAELLNKSDQGVYSLVGTPSPWGAYGTDVSDPDRFRVSTFNIVDGTPSGLLATGAEFAAMRLQNTSSSAHAVASGVPVRCSMKGDEAAQGAEQADVFSVYLKDVFKPSLTHEVDPATNIAHQIKLVPGINYNNGAYSTAIDLFAQSWYRAGVLARFAVEASDRGSGLDRIQISKPNTPFPDAFVPPSGAAANIDACATNTGTFESPCPTRLDAWAAETIMGSRPLNQGLNTVWYRATDFSGNRTETGPLHFLYDSVAPNSPETTFGTAVEPTSPDADANLPTFDTKDVVILRWAKATDPGDTATPVATGSGIGSYTIRVEQRAGYGAWVPASAHPDVITHPVPAGATAPVTLDIAGREGIFRVSMTATDRAENVSAPTVRYFRIDTTDPMVALDSPAGEDPIQLRSLKSDSGVSARVIDPSVGGSDDASAATAALAVAGNNDPIDVVTLQRRTGPNPGDWTDVVSVAGQRWSTTGSPVAFTPFAPANALGGIGNGMHDLRVQARDGAKGNGAFWHEGASRTFKACLDTALHNRADDVRPTAVTAIPITYAGSTKGGARIEFSVPSGATQLAYKWIVEALVNDVWTEVAAPLQQGATTTYRVDDWFARPFGTRYRVSAATQWCTHVGDPTIALDGTTADTTLIVEQPERVMPLLGLESRWSYWSLPAGSGTDAHVNTATGNVVVTRPLLAEPGVGLWTNVQLTYNSQQVGDDELLASNGIAGAHMTLAVGPGGSSADADAAASGFLVAEDAVVMRDSDGTIRVFEPTLAPSNPNWNGAYRATDGARLLLRNVQVQRGDDDRQDGIVGAVFKLTRPDGVTYYYARERSINGVAQSELGRLLAVRDREGHQLTYAYECVAVMPKADGVTRAYRVHRKPGGSWAQVPESAGVQLVHTCPGNVVNVAGAHAAASMRMRLVAVRDERFAAGNGREVRMSYHSPESDFAGHVRMIRGHESGGRARQVLLTYEIVGADRTVQLRDVTIVGRRQESRSVTFEYDPEMNDPGKWFDKNVILGSVSDFMGRPTRFNYDVPDADAGFLFVNPRASRVENRKDVIRGDGRGVTLQYHLRPGFGADGLFAMRLSGATTMRDQLDRATRYTWNADDPFSSEYGRTNALIAPGGLVTHLVWNANNEITKTRRTQPLVEREPVHIPDVGKSRVLTWPIVASTARIEDASGANITARYSVDSRGVIIADHRPGDAHTVYVTYRPDATREQVTDTVRDSSSGVPTRNTTDKRWRVALGDRERSSYGAGDDRPDTELTWTPSAGPAVTRPLVRDLAAIVSPLGGAAHRTDIDVDPATGRVQGVESPGGSGRRSTQSLTYYASGLLRSSTDALGWTVAYAGYTDDGEPTVISKRFCTAPPAGGVGSCGTPLPGWNPHGDEDQVASVIPQAFRVSYTPDAEVSCIRDVRGDTSNDHARFVAFRYDDFGAVTEETSPWKRDHAGKRVRRITAHSYDMNGNLIHSTRDAPYELGASFAASDCSTFPSASGGTTVSRWIPSVPHTEYDELDRVVVSRTLSNNHDGANRVSRTRYDLVGNVEWQSQPNHEASSAGFDFTTSTKYDDRDRPIDVTDGERRHTCTYYDAYDNPVAETPSRWQGRNECPDAPRLSHSTFQTFDNAGTVVSSRAISGKVSFTLTDDEANPIRSEATGAEREARSGALVTDLRITIREFDAAGNLVVEQLPRRLACTGASVTSCTPGSQTSVVPTVTHTYDVLSRLVSTRTARQNAENGLASTHAASFAYDADGRRISETLARGTEAVRIARTTYDKFGNPIQVTLPNSASSSVQERFSTFFAYGDDDALVTKNDRAHDVLTTWGYDRRGYVVSRTEHGFGDEDEEWQSTQQFSFNDDGSIIRGPMSVAEFVPQRVYADGTCLRAPGSRQSAPAFVFLVLGDQQFSKAGAAPNFLASSWQVGQVRRSGKLRLRKLSYAGGVTRTYDENGLPLTVEGCGTKIRWTRRDGVGEPLTIENQDGGDVSYRYDNGGALVESLYPDGRARTARYVQPDSDPFTVDPGAGLEEIVAIDRPNLKKRYLQMSYIYTLDGAVDVEGRAATGIYSVEGGSIRGLTPTGYTTYEYDHVGALIQSRVLKTAAAQQAAKPSSKLLSLLSRAKPANAVKPAQPANGKPAVNPGRKLGLQGVELSQEDVIRDIAGNPRRITTSVQLARSKPRTNSARTQSRYFAYDVLDRVSSDDVSALPKRDYRYDALGRLDRVLVGSQVLQDYAYNDSAARGAMLTRSITNGLTDATRQLTVMDYGNGLDHNSGATFAGPRGQLVRSTRYDGKTRSTGLDHTTTYDFTHLNQQAAAIEQSFEPLRTRQARSNRARKRTDNVRSYMNYDLLGRRSSTSDYTDDLSDTSAVKRSATLAKFTGDAADPYSESTSDPKQPSVRWMLRANDRLVGELRQQTPRYHVGNHQGSTLMTLAGNTEQTVTATFDYDTWGEPLTGNISLESGSDAAQRHNIYGFTGMRESNAGQTTYHHARDYRPDLHAWLQTDQYMDPMADLGLSMSTHTRERSAYAWNNPVANTDRDGHDCSSGSGVSGGAACAEALNNYCKRHPEDPRCKRTKPVRAEHVEENDRQVIAASGGSPSYVTNPNDHSVAGSTVRPALPVVKLEARTATTPIEWNAPSLPWDQRLQAGLDRRADSYTKQVAGMRLAGWCASGGGTAGIPRTPFREKAGIGGDLTGCVTYINGDLAFVPSVSIGPGTGLGGSATTGPYFTDAERTSGLRGVGSGGGSSVGPVNIDADQGFGGNVNSAMLGVGPGTGAEIHSRATWVPFILGDDQ